MKKIISFILVVSMAFALVFAFAGCQNSESAEPENEISEVPEDPTDEVFKDEVSSEEVKEKIISALEEIEVDAESIGDFEKTEDGNYIFTYMGKDFTVTMDENSEVSSVRLEESGEDLYLKGYEPYKAEDFMMPEYMKAHLIGIMKNLTELEFNMPESMEFDESAFAFRHEGDYYYTTGTVKINGGEKEHTAEMICSFIDNTIETQFFAVDGKTSISFTNKIVRPERQKTENP